MDFDAVAFLSNLFRPDRQLHPEDLPSDWQFVYEERAGIMQFCGNLTRAQAEALALTDTVRRMRKEHG